LFISWVVVFVILLLFLMIVISVCSVVRYGGICRLVLLSCVMISLLSIWVEVF